MNSRLFCKMWTCKFLSLGIYQSLIRSWTQERCMRKFCYLYILRPLEAQILYPRRNFRIYPYLKKVDVLESDKNKSQSTKKNKSGPKVLIIDETGKESSMYKNEAEKYAKKNKLRLIKVEDVGGKREVYKFDKETNIILKEAKSKTSSKKFILRDSIQSHDLETKINMMFKFVEKGVPVICLIENVSAQNKSKELLSQMKTSKLKDYLTVVRESSKRVHLTFQNLDLKKINTKTENFKTEDESA